MYFYLKAFHIIAVICWFAALFYLPRLFVYHAENRDKADFVSVVKIMQAKLVQVIAIPAFFATWLTGLLLIYNNWGLLKSGWLHAKIGLLVLLSVYFWHLVYIQKLFAQDRCEKSGRFFRIYNEVPTLFLLSVVILAVVKPF